MSTSSFPHCARVCIGSLLHFVSHTEPNPPQIGLESCDSQVCFCSISYPPAKLEWGVSMEGFRV